MELQGEENTLHRNQKEATMTAEQKEARIAYLKSEIRGRELTGANINLECFGRSHEYDIYMRFCEELAELETAA